MTTARQIATAQRLARAFGHEWGSTDISNVNMTASLADVVEAVRQATRQQRDPGTMSCGIEAPMVDRDGDVFHNSTTRRLKWDVVQDGTVILTVGRSNGPVLSCWVEPTPPVAVDGDIIHGPWDGHGLVEFPLGRGRLDYGREFHHRHVEALLNALVPLCGRSRALRAVAHLWAQALPDEGCAQIEALAHGQRRAMEAGMTALRDAAR